MLQDNNNSKQTNKQIKNKSKNRKIVVQKKEKR